VELRAGQDVSTKHRNLMPVTRIRIPGRRARSLDAKPSEKERKSGYDDESDVSVVRRLSRIRKVKR
jgi:hypothetical protein